MEKLDSLSMASMLVFSHLKRGAITNHVMTQDEYRAEIATNSLYAHNWPGGVLFLRKRVGYHMLTYIVNDTNIQPHIALPTDTFIEIAQKPLADIGSAIAFWARAGFEVTLKRLRLTRSVDNMAEKSTLAASCGGVSASQTTVDNHGIITTAAMADVKSCDDLLRACFDAKTGHLPSIEELTADIAKGCVLCIKDPDNTVCGLLRYKPHTASVEIKQLALRYDMRGKGLARQLVGSFVGMHGSKKLTVWMNEGYVPAMRSYTACGFLPDGWRAHVLTIV